MRKFVIDYQKIQKYGATVPTKMSVTIPKSTGDTSIDAKNATELFIKTIGSLKKYDILSMQEVSESGDPIGEPIKPMADTAIVPSI